MPMREHLGEFEQLLLFALLVVDEEGAYGIPIRRAIEQRTGRVVSAGAVYTALERLARRGFVTSRFGEAVPARGGRRKKYYELTPAGALALSRSYETLWRMADGLRPKLARLVEQEAGTQSP